MGFVLMVFLDAYIARIPKTDGDSIPPWSEATLCFSDCKKRLGFGQIATSAGLV